jgi:hypothetical protein
MASGIMASFSRAIQPSGLPNWAPFGAKLSLGARRAAVADCGMPGLFHPKQRSPHLTKKPV